jgi:hypothetical protein
MIAVPQKPHTSAYVGMRINGSVQVYVHHSDGCFTPLKPRYDLRNHSPDGFEWGYAGSGPAQLALAILADALDDDVCAARLHQVFKTAVVANLTKSSFIMEHRLVLVVAKRLCVDAGYPLPPVLQADLDEK